MATFQSQILTFSPLPSSSSTSTRKQPIRFEVKSVLQFPNLAKSSSTQRLSNPKFVLNEINQFISTTRQSQSRDDLTYSSKMHAILEAISDRIEMHTNIKEQRDNWNSLLLNSSNMITLTATLIATVASAADLGPTSRVSSVILFAAATAILAIMNKIQPSQLVEEQRNAVRLFKSLQTRIQTQMNLNGISESDVADAMERVLAIDRAYPLPLLGGMLDKFPKSFEAARWWPDTTNKGVKGSLNRNGWTPKLEEEVREIAKLVKGKDLEDYERLGTKALKVSKVLAVAGPVLTGLAGVGAVMGMGVVVGVFGSLASVAASVEHGGQVGMVLEMYRNCAGAFKEMEEDVERAVVDKEEDGGVFEVKMALRLGRSLSELRDLATRSIVAPGEVDEFANKLF